jgi:diaminopimelate decarboxylase
MSDRDRFLLELASRYGTPLYAYDLQEVVRRRNELGRVLPAGSRLLYSLKANPLASIGNVLSPDCDAEVSSEGELRAALDAGFDRAHILFTGPGKTEWGLNVALAEGVRYFSAESWTDLARLARVAMSRGSRPQVLLRINAGSASGSGLSMSGNASHFGFDEASLLASLDKWREFTRAVEFVGLHVYSGTQLRDAAALAASFRVAFSIVTRVGRHLGIPVRVADVGGGFPWPFATNESTPVLEPLANELADISRTWISGSDREVWFEAGRYLCASSGTLIATVLDVKRSGRGHRQIVLDAGINVLGGMSGLGRVLAGSISVIPLENAIGETEPAAILGPLCTPLDVLGRGVALPAVQPGAKVAIPNVGAYGLRASLLAFLDHPAPIEVAYRNDEVVTAHQLQLMSRRVD